MQVFLLLHSERCNKIRWLSTNSKSNCFENNDLNVTYIDFFFHETMRTEDTRYSIIIYIKEIKNTIKL